MEPFEGLELYDGKLSRTVLKGGSNALALTGRNKDQDNKSTIGEQASRKELGLSVEILGRIEFFKRTYQSAFGSREA